MDFDKIIQELKGSKIVTGKYVGIGVNTINTYIAKLKHLEKMDALNQNITEAIKNKYNNLNTQSAYYVAIIGVAKHSPSFAHAIGEDLINAVSELNEQNIKKKKDEPMQIKTEKEEENWVSLKDLKLFAKEKENQMTPQENVMVALYTLIPPARLDYDNVRLIRGMPGVTLKKINVPEIYKNANYVKVATTKTGRHNTELTLNEYKTSKVYGTNIVKLPLSITKLIMKLPPTQNYLFVSNQKKNIPFSSAKTYGVYLRSVFNKLTGKNISANLLRHIYLSSFRGGEKSEAKKLIVAKRMGHSVNTQTLYLRLA
jgi:hypothetical protein